VEHAEEADFSAEMLRVGGDLQKRRGAGAKQEVVDDLLVMERQRRELMRKRKDHMRIRNIEQFLVASGEPLFPRVGLALWTMAISA
jgi:hypothetical protein